MTRPECVLIHSRSPYRLKCSSSLTITAITLFTVWYIISQQSLNFLPVSIQKFSLGSILPLSANWSDLNSIKKGPPDPIILTFKLKRVNVLESN
jgi:hypothetical protein